MTNHRILSTGGAVMIILVLALSAALVIQSLRSESRRKIEAHTLNVLDNLSQLVQVWELDYQRATRSIADDPKVVQLVQDVLAAQGAERERRSTMLGDWLQPAYRSRGFQGFALITPDAQIAAGSSPAFIGRTASPETRHAMALLQSQAAVVTRPTVARYPLGQTSAQQPAGTVFQLSCAAVVVESKMLATLCLRLLSANSLFEILRSSAFDRSGEVYLIDRSGRMLSPSRFQDELTKGQMLPAADGLPFLWAREPIRGRNGQIQKLGNQERPLTRLAAATVLQPETGFITDYPNYRGIAAIGAGRWLPGMDVGLIIEQSEDEAFGQYHYAASAIVALCALAALLVLVLTAIIGRSRLTLAASERRFRTVLQHMPATFDLKDRQGRYLLVNPAYAAQIGQPESNIIGLTDFEVRPGLAREIQAAEQQVLLQQQHITTTTHYQDAHGHTRYSQVVRFPVWSADQQIEAIGAIAIDITEQQEGAAQLAAITRNLETLVQQRTAQLAEAKEAEEAASRAKADFLANMSHEIRTPMNAIIGLSDLALRLDTGAKERRYLERIHGAGRHLLALINNILDFSKIEAGKVWVDAAEFSLQQMLEHVVGMVADEAGRKELELAVDVDPAIPDALVGDSLRIGQILINLVSNAIKFTDAGYVLLKVRLCQSEAGRVRLRFGVKDSGIGIAPEHLEQLFQSFQQVDGSSTRRYAGSGLGLAICRRLIEVLGGAIDVASEPGTGSEFSVELDLVRGIEPRTTLPTLSPQRALLIEPQPMSGAILADLLRQQGWAVTQAPSSPASLQGYQLVLAAPDLLAATPSQPGAKLWRVALTGHGAGQVVGCDDTLEKPILPIAVKRLVQRIAASPTPAVSPPPKPKLHGLRVLLVEDNPVNEEVAQELLHSMGVAVSIARNGREAVAAVARQAFDVVLMDVQMPEMDGLSATRLIRADARFAKLPIIALTAGAFPDDRVACLAAGMNEHLTKPIVADKLSDVLLRWSGRQEAEHDLPAAEQASVLPQITGLDLEQARRQLLGRDDLLLRVLRRVQRERRQVGVELQQAWAAGNLAEVSRLAHDTAGIAGTIGAMTLRKHAHAVEAALAANLATEETLKPLLTEFAQVLAGLDQALPLDPVSELTA